MDGEVYNMPRKPMTPDQALYRMIDVELGYGSVVTEISETSVTFVSTTLRCVDTAIYSGTADEMELLVKTAACYVELSGKAGDCQGFTARIAEIAVERSKALPPFAEFEASRIAGRAITRAALLGAFGIGNEGEVYTAVRSAFPRLMDLVAGLLLRRESGLTLAHIAAAM